MVSTFFCSLKKKKKKKKKRDQVELNHRPIGLQPIALPLSYSPTTSAEYIAAEVEPALKLFYEKKKKKKKKKKIDTVRK